MAGEQFSLVWNSFPSNLSTGLYSLLTDEHLVDVTLAAEGKILRAHKLILSVCSTYFRDLFKGNTCKHPIVILKDVNYRDLSAMLHFMYQGEVNIKQEDIASFLKVAETLQIKGLTRDNTENKKKSDDDTDKLEETIKSEKESDDQEDSESFEQNLLNLPDHNNFPNDESKETASSSSVIFQNPNHLKAENEMQAMLTNNYMNTDRIPSEEIEPLDFTSDIHQDSKDTDKPLDCRYGRSHLTSTPTKSSENEVQSPPPPENLSYHEDYHEDISEPNQDPNCSTDSPYDSPCQSKPSKGRRTVKGIPHSTLPLETTLRVVSELGPTLRLERGKVVRMYSCPWCLRHFTRKENLKLHVRYIHGPLESLTCKLCGNKYKNSNSLRVHSYLYHNTKRNKHNKSLVASNI